MRMVFKPGEMPLLFKMAVGLFFVSLGTGTAMLVWRNICAPMKPRPGYECVSRGGRTEYFVPCWFNTVNTVTILTGAAAFILMPIIYGAYPHLHASPDEGEDN
jgi:hypothetical protein